MLLSPVTDHAVLQRDVPIPLFGCARPGAAIIVDFRGQRWTATAEANGRWRVAIGPFPAGGPDVLTLASPDERVTLRDLLVGEVWVLSGQSNMAFSLRGAEHGARDAARADCDTLRLLRLPGCVAAAPREHIPAAAWTPCRPETAADFSAVGYYFGRRLTAALGVPVGLVQAAVGNTPGESWVPPAVLEDDPLFQPIFARWRRSLAAFPDPANTYAQAFAAWEREADSAERAGRPIPGAFPKLVGPGHPWTPGGLYHGMIAPLTAFPIRGVLWMQGAAAPERAFQYRELFRRLIRHWRAAWGGDFLFFFAQEADFGPKRDAPGEHSWAELREAQALALAEPRTGMVVAVDTGEEHDIHPKRKEPLGERFALLARALVHGEDVPYSGPVLAGMTAEGSRIRLHFTHTYGGLRTADGLPPAGFAVSPGATDFSRGNRNFVWAQARIEGDDIVVWADAVPRPAAVRYAWAQNPTCNLVNAAGLPAAPFRTDDWPGITVANR